MTLSGGAGGQASRPRTAGWASAHRGHREGDQRGRGVWATQDSRVDCFELAALRREQRLPAAGSLGVLSPHPWTPSHIAPAGRKGQHSNRPHPPEFPKVG